MTAVSSKVVGKSILRDAEDVKLAIELIEHGARIQVLETETGLSRDRLIRLYKEVRGVSPPKGMFPFSADWFITWQPNIHTSLFYNGYKFLLENGDGHQGRTLVKAYRLYLESVALHDGEVALDLMRAWTAVRFFASDILQLTACSRCKGSFVTHAHDPKPGYVCGLCRPPSRAGATNRRKAERAASEDPLGAMAHEFVPHTVPDGFRASVSPQAA